MSHVLTDRIARWLDRILGIAPTTPSQVDLVFCLAGRKRRKLYALELFAAGKARQLILSTGRFELRRYPELPGVPQVDLLAIAASIPPPLRHYFVLIRDGCAYPQLIAKRRLGTYSEIVALGAWLAEHSEIQSVALVSSASHLRRIRRCWRALAPRSVRVEFLATPGEEAQGLRALLSEVSKLMLYTVVLFVRAPEAKRLQQQVG